MDSRFDRIMNGVGLPALFAAFGEPGRIQRLSGETQDVKVMLRQRFALEEIEGLHVGVGDAIAELKASDIAEPLTKGDIVQIGGINWTVQRLIDQDGLTISYLVRRS